MQAIDPLGPQSSFLDLTTGHLTLAKMPDQQLVELNGSPFPYIIDGVWDPVEPADLYAVKTDHITDDRQAFYSLWRMNVETLVGTQLFPLGTNDLCDITPDGRYLLFDRWNEGINSPSRYSLETHTWTPLPEEEMLYRWRTYAPNGELLAGVTIAQEEQENSVLTIRDLSTDRLAQVFNPNQTWFTVPHGARNLMGAPTWLPDSAGLLVNTLSSGNYGTNTIWQVGVNGEACAIASGVTVIANSQNGRYWLLRQGEYWQEQQFYIMALEDTSPEE